MLTVSQGYHASMFCMLFQRHFTHNISSPLLVKFGLVLRPQWFRCEMRAIPMFVIEFTIGTQVLWLGMC